MKPKIKQIKQKCRDCGHSKYSHEGLGMVHTKFQKRGMCLRFVGSERCPCQKYLGKE